MLNPLKALHYRIRIDLIQSLCRLVFAGLHAVQWRDAYLGDLCCSLTYSFA
ncbi:hypothetical protein E8E12_000505 [Didymella heteroderae]|uniref:EXS domain-containing protein n=1 Tax=Didymella heteroderae TaxID=1769908 RepID=A0A9P4WGC7_9PLEO|nr:hypothetical protein E8E12_000505 [Didymella heteroderae]